MKQRILSMAAAALGVMMLAPVGTAHAQVVVNFESEASGSKANGYTVGGITFNDTMGADLAVDNYGGQGVGTRSLGVFGDDASGLEMLFATTSTNLSLIFGNDDSCCSSAGDVALLRIFMGATQVGQTTVVMNRNDLADQTIAINGIGFNRATFFYTNAALNPINLIEVVDNITYTPGAAAGVPEPATWAMMVMGFGAVGFSLRRRTKQQARVRFA